MAEGDVLSQMFYSQRSLCPHLGRSRTDTMESTQRERGGRTRQEEMKRIKLLNSKKKLRRKEGNEGLKERKHQSVQKERSLSESHVCHLQHMSKAHGNHGEKDKQMRAKGEKTA